MKKILAIETSCDDTCVAIMKDGKILSSVVSSQINIHKKWGGVFPTLARREHQKNLIPVLKRALKESGFLEPAQNDLSTKEEKIKELLSREEILLPRTISFLKKTKRPEIDLLCVTTAPGLEPSLWTGINLAKTLSFYWEIPLVSINHIEGHIFANFLQQEEIAFPAIALVASGGHTELILIKQEGCYQTIGETKDDAAGECFDKTARILGLEYPGGPIISKLAEKAKGSLDFQFPRPMLHEKNYDFSFSGLKTAVLYKRKELPKKLSQKLLYLLAKEIQQAIIDVLISKTAKAARNFQAKTVILGGGVTANQELRKQLREKLDPTIKLLIPNTSLSIDNAAMVASCCFYGNKKPVADINELEARSKLRL